MNGPEHLEILGPLGVDQGAFVARDTSTGAARLVVVERLAGASSAPAERGDLLRRGRALRALEHPKVVRVRDVFERDAELLVVSDYVDGEWLSSLMMEPHPPLGVMLRVVVDVLEGLAALHVLRDGGDEPFGLVHGALGPHTVIVAEEGVAEIAGACRLPRPGPDERYIAPELRRGKHPDDVRSDIYSVGSILRDVLADAPSDAAWAEPLNDIAWRGCSADPENRWPSALAMATSVRRIAGPKLATTAAVAELMRRRFGEKTRARRAALEAVHEESPPPSSAPLSLSASEMVLVDPSSESTLAKALPPMRRTPPPPPRTPPPARTPSPTGTSSPPAPRTLPSKDSLPVRLAPRPSLPPPTIVPGDAPKALEAYRRRMPTFPTFEEEPSRTGRAVLQGISIGGAVVVAFATGWWFGRNYEPAAATAGPAVASVAPAAVATTSPPPPATSTDPSAVSPAAAAPAASVASAMSRAIASAATRTPAWGAGSPARTSTPRATPSPTAEVAAPTGSATHGGYPPEEL
jgi:serine/threonine protein kinase